MKTGCFIKGFIISTILLAAVLYIAINKYDEYLAKPVKEYIVGIAKTEFNEKLDSLNLEIPRDSVTAFLDRAGETIISLPGFSNDKISSFADSVGRVFSDKTISVTEFERLQQLLNELKRDEK